MIKAILLLPLFSAALASYNGGWDPNFCCYPPGPECCPEEEDCDKCLDVVFVVDKSSSVGNTRLRTEVIPFMQKFALSSQWTIGNMGEEFQFALVTFDTASQLRINWGDPEAADSMALDAELNSLKSLSGFGFSNLGSGMKKARERVIMNVTNNRDNCRDLCIVMSDLAVKELPGGGDTAFQTQLPLFKNACDRIIAIGIVTSALDPAALTNVATSADDAFVLSGGFEPVESRVVAIAEECDPSPPVCKTCLDVAIVMDRSSSVGNWRVPNKLIPFLGNFSISVPIGRGDDEHQVGLVTFNSNPQLRWAWNASETDNANSLNDAFQALSSVTGFGFTNLGSGMKKAREQIIGGPSNRADCADVCIVMSDMAVVEPSGGGDTIFQTQKPLFEAVCDVIIAVGIQTTSLNVVGLNTLATSLNDVFSVNDFDTFIAKFPSYSDLNDCTTPAPTPAPSTPPSGCCPYDFPFYARFI